MNPGDRAVLERLALELEIYNRRTELDRALHEKPVLDGRGLSVSDGLRSHKNSELHQTLRFELQMAIERRAKRSL